MISNLMW